MVSTPGKRQQTTEPLNRVSLSCENHIPSHRRFVIVRHLQSRPLEPAFDVEALVCLGAVEDRLVAADFFSHVVEGLNDPQAEFLPLLIFSNCDVFDVSHLTEVVNTVFNVSRLSSSAIKLLLLQL